LPQLKRLTIRAPPLLVKWERRAYYMFVLSEVVHCDFGHGSFNSSSCA